MLKKNSILEFCYFYELILNNLYLKYIILISISHNISLYKYILQT